jgi:hypothetical protein
LVAIRWGAVGTKLQDRVGEKSLEIVLVFTSDTDAVNDGMDHLQDVVLPGVGVAGMKSLCKGLAQGDALVERAVGGNSDRCRLGPVTARSLAGSQRIR